MATGIDTGVKDGDERLRRNGFFDMSACPEITFTSSGVEHGGGDS